MSQKLRRMACESLSWDLVCDNQVTLGVPPSPTTLKCPSSVLRTSMPKWSDLWNRGLPTPDTNSAATEMKTKRIPEMEMAENCP